MYSASLGSLSITFSNPMVSADPRGGSSLEVGAVLQ
jgi:hypothetical protein